MKLILNADDFGLSESVNNGIKQCFQTGLVKSTTVMMNQPGLQHAIKLYQQGDIPEVGLHFTVTSGKPVLLASEVASLVDDQGFFFSRAKLQSKSNVDEQQVYNELAAQYQAAIAAGFEINHLDSHHFAGVYAPLKNAFIRFANDINLPVRRVDNIVAGQDNLKVATPDAFDMRFFDTGVSLEQLKALLLSYKAKMPEATLELMCHPSTENNADLIGLTGYIEKRITERDLLTSLELKTWLDDEGIECVGFNQYRP